MPSRKQLSVFRPKGPPARLLLGSWILLASLASTTAATAQGFVTNGRLNFGFPVDPANPLGGNVDIVWDGVDQAFQFWFWYRVLGEVSETPFPSPDEQEYDDEQDLITLRWNDLTGTGIEAQLELYVADCGNPSDPCVAGDRGLINSYLFLANLTALDQNVVIFPYLDLDAGGTGGGDDARYQTVYGNLDGIEVRDAAGPPITVTWIGGHDWSVAPYPQVRNELNDNNLDLFFDSGLPLLDSDVTIGLQRGITLPALDSDLASNVQLFIDPLLFTDGFESGNLSQWSASQ